MSVLGSLISGTFGLAQQHMQNEFNAEQADINRQFQSVEAKLAYERTLQADSTKHQREVQDMLAAGINPMLAAGSSGGSVQASPASGSQASAANVGNLGAIVNQAMMNDKQMALVDANIAKTNAETDKTRSEIEGIDLHNQILEATKDSQILAVDLDNQLKQVNVGLLKDKRLEVTNNIRKLAREASTEEQKAAYYSAAAAVQRASEKEISELLAAKKTLMSAQSEQARQAAALSAAHKAYQLKLIDEGYVDAFITNEKEVAKKAGSEAISAEAKAQLDQIRAAIRTGNYEATSLVEVPVITTVLQGVSNFLDNFNPLAGLLR